MAEKKPRGLRPWLDDIQLDGSGKYAYKGSHMKFAGDETQRKRFLLTLGLSMGGAAVCTVAAGCLNVSDADNTMYVLIPYMIEVIAAVAFVWSSAFGVMVTAGSELHSTMYSSGGCPAGMVAVSVTSVCGRAFSISAVQVSVVMWNICFASMVTVTAWFGIL